MTAEFNILGRVPNVTALLRSTPEAVELAAPCLTSADIPQMLRLWHSFDPQDRMDALEMAGRFATMSAVADDNRRNAEGRTVDAR